MTSAGECEMEFQMVNEWVTADRLTDIGVIDGLRTSVGCLLNYIMGVCGWHAKICESRRRRRTMRLMVDE